MNWKKAIAFLSILVASETFSRGADDIPDTVQPVISAKIHDTSRPLPKAVQADVTGLYAMAKDEADLAGEIHFQTVSAFPVAPLDEAHPLDQGFVV